METVHDAFHVYDTTLRDGAQGEGMALTVADKLAIAQHLDDLGVGFIEGGWPGALPKDTEFFRRAQTELTLKNATLSAFGATRKAGVKAADDPQVAALRDSMAPVVCLVAKSHDRHVFEALKTTLDENLAMIRDTVSYLRSEGRRVFLDAEHFFDGYKSNPAYALECVRVAAEAGADVITLCDTNGGMLPTQLQDIVHEVLQGSGARLGIHCHDDTGCAVANTLAAVDAGVTHVQGVVNGYGERCGNANLVTVVANLELKLGRRVLPDNRIAELSSVSHAVAEIANQPPRAHQPYVGLSAFAHKAGLHASAIKVAPDLYQHIEPAMVGNDMRMLVSEMAGRASVEMKSRQLGYDLSQDKATVGRVVDRVKDLEAKGFMFEAADASFELLLREEVSGEPAEYFKLESWRVIVERRADGEVVSEATVKVDVKGERIVSTGEGNGPVNALDRALRQALERLYPQLGQLELVDYKVRILDGAHGTGAVTRVLIETSDGETEWNTIGVDDNIIAASWGAMEDAYNYGLLRQDAGS
ncbi:MAG TPA: citramalate synthase, partial [Acidothermaceae bacterium]|nr:citramalate synthase [Acidothermaceae bacterium]